jgi:hypothetical protein
MQGENDNNEKKYVTKEELAMLRRSIMAVIELLNDQMADLEEELAIANRSSLEQALGVVARRKDRR